MADHLDAPLRWPGRTEILNELDWNAVSLRAVDSMAPQELAVLMREMPGPMLATFTGLVGMRDAAAKIQPGLAGRIAQRVRQSKSWEHVSRLLTPIAPVFHQPFDWTRLKPEAPSPGLEDPEEVRRRTAWGTALWETQGDSRSERSDGDLAAVREALTAAAAFLRRSPSLEAALLCEVVLSSPVPAVGIAYLALIDPDAASAHATLQDRYPDMPIASEPLSRYRRPIAADTIECANPTTAAASVEDAAGNGGDAGEAEAWQPGIDGLRRAHGLMDQAPVLSRGLLGAAERVTRGELPSDPDLPVALKAWMDDAAELLNGLDQSLPAVIEHLEAEEQRRQAELELEEERRAQEEAERRALTERREELYELRKAMSALAEQGLGHMGAPMLADKGLASIEELDAELEVLGVPASSGASTEDAGASGEMPADADDRAETAPASVPVAKAEHEAQKAAPAESELSVPEKTASVKRITERLDEDNTVDRSAPPRRDSPLPEAAEHSAPEVLDVAASRGASEDSQVSPIEDPWAGTPPVAADLIASGHERLAYLLSLNSADKTRQSVLYSFASAFGLRADVAQVHLAEIVQAAEDHETLGREESRVLLSAGIRLALGLGYMPIALEPLRDKADLEDHPANAVINAAIQLAMRGYKRPGASSEGKDLPRQWAEVATGASRVLTDLSSARVSFHRATKIAHYLARDTQPVGEALSALIQISKTQSQGEVAADNLWEPIETVAHQLRNDNGIERLINDTYRAVSTPQQAMKPIVAGAREKLLSLIRAVASVMQSGLELRQQAADPGREHSDVAAAFAATRAQFQPFDASGVGDAALLRLGEWIVGDGQNQLVGVSLEAAIQRELTPIFEIARDAQGRPTRSPTNDEVLELVEPRPMLDVVEGYMATGNIATAEALLAAQTGVATETEEALQRSKRDHERRRQELLSRAESLISRLRTLEDDDRARELAIHLERSRDMEPGRFDLAIGPIEALVYDAEDHLDHKRDSLRARAAQLASKSDADRILGRIADGDEVLASEYLALCESGQALPVFVPPAKDDLAIFFPRLVELAGVGKTADEVAATLRADLGHAAAPTHRLLREGLSAWTKLATQKQGGGVGATMALMAAVLRLIGLIPDTNNWHREITRQRRAGYAAWTIKARPQELAYIPFYGTRANGTYDVTVVWDDSTPQRLIELVDDDRRNKANIILYLGVLSVKQRLELRRIAGRSGPDVAPLVIDSVVVAWLSSLEEPSWRATQRVTLPFTTANPYIPFGEVPDEMFVGRVEERSQIEDPTGSLFVYGGRQLGKSALLRRVERGVMRTGTTDNGEPPSRVAIYFDLKSSNIGEGHEPSRLWTALQPRLSDVGVLDAKRKAWTTDAIVDGIATWLKEDQSRTMLLLLDEADNFLTYDATDKGPTGLGGFPTLQRLKGLMERSDRRFKPVFAGLHQVQRFHGLPNTPVVHGGSDILIGPLKDRDARDLVRDPLYALGYRFENDETMWRLLLHTNYQASLIQIVCDSLVRHVRTSATSGADGRIVITSRHVDEVYAKREVRELIADRFQWTINLDPRYRVIAQVVALRSLDAQPGESFRPSDLHDDCEFYWGEGFSRRNLSSSEFRRYLNEMTGLGVLHRQDEGYNLRSPSILGLLGSRAELEEQLVEASETLALENPYNPAVNRRLLGNQQQRSPLPDADLARLLDHSESAERILAVVGSRALGIERVVDALQLAAGDKPVDCQVNTADEMAALQRVTPDRHYIVDLTHREPDPAVLRAVVGRIRTAHTTGLTLVASATQARSLRQLLPDVAHLELKRWSAEGLQQLLKETPFSTPAHTADLLRVTGGWPSLVERALMLVDTRTREETLETIDREQQDPKIARRLVSAADVPVDVLTAWVEWFAPGEACSVADLEAAEVCDDLASLLSNLETLDALEETQDGLQLNPVLAAGLRLV